MIDPAELGATLYVPANRPDLSRIVGARDPELRSAVLCLEDAVHPSEVPLALANLARLLRSDLLSPAGEARPLALFVRPRDEAMLAHILTFEGVENLAGFVIPKATADSLPAYLRRLSHVDHQLMPTLETGEVLDGAEMRRLRDQLLSVQDRILAIRIGGNDLLQSIGARRSAVRTAYDGPLGSIIASLVGAFAPYGFALTAPVFEHFANDALLREEVERDLEHGLFSKTAIHPRQVKAIQACYRVHADELAEAEAILRGDVRAVFASRGAMCEVKTHQRWARSILERARNFGVIEADKAAIA